MIREVCYRCWHVCKHVRAVLNVAAESRVNYYYSHTSFSLDYSYSSACGREYLSYSVHFGCFFPHVRGPEWMGYFVISVRACLSCMIFVMILRFLLKNDLDLPVAIGRFSLVCSLVLSLRSWSSPLEHSAAVVVHWAPPFFVSSLNIALPRLL